MALVSDIITDAYRESNLIAVSTTPTTPEMTEGLTLFNRYLASVYGTDAGEELLPVIVGDNNISRPVGYPGYNQVPEDSDWFVPSNSRLLLNLSDAQTVYLDPNPEDGARFAFIDKSSNLDTYNLTVNANGRTIATNTTLTVSTADAAQEYFYRADQGDWVLVTPLEDDDTFPFPVEFEDMFVIGLAIRLNPRHGRTLDDQSGSTYSRLLKSFKSRYRQSAEVSSELGLLKTSIRRFFNYNTRRGNREFETGRTL